MKDLSTRVAELFSPKPWKHDYDTLGSGGKCYKCDAGFYDATAPDKCTSPDPIDITDLGKALEAYRTTPVLRRLPAQRQVRGDWGMGTDREEYLNWWMINEVTAEQIWEICCLAKESKSI